MTKLSLKNVLLLILLCFFCFAAISNGRNSKYEDVSPVVILTKEYYKTHFNNFQIEVKTLVSLLGNSESSPSIEKVRSQLTTTRLAFKEIEFLFDYYNPDYNYAFINGGPLPKFSERFGGGEILEPQGLQALDELIFEVDADSNYIEIKALAARLQERVNHIEKVQFPIVMNENQIIEALRSGLVRVFTLGVTGFDTPGSGNAIEEGIQSMQSMLFVFSIFNERLEPNAKPLFNGLKKQFNQGVKQLKKENDFDDFNRLTFLKEVVNPLYGKLLEFQRLNKVIETKYQFHAQNYEAKNLFAEDFLDTNFYSEFVYLPLENPKTISLGKKLFEDPQLSNGSKMSCATCHSSSKGFGDGLPKSKTNEPNVFTARNSPSIINAGYATRYFWDMREHNLEKQVGHVIDNDLEFNTSFDEIIKKLNSNSEYVELFEEAYSGIHRNNINQRSISNAIAAYVNALKSLNSDFDRYVRNEIEDYPEAAKRGFNLFMGKAACGTCHFAPMFNGTVPPFYTESESEVLGITMGLDTISPVKDPDLGRAGNGLLQDNYPFFEHSFKTVTVRNAEHTGPYMHNGLFNTLEEVMEFYNHGGGAGMGLDIENQTLSMEPLGLTAQEKADIIVFMKTLTDMPSALSYTD